ncbi:recombinase family protein [Pseudofrankia inefficax]|uniref:Resolvase domain protein n=1 Tax=Pseudofrankia inefficax (strain DSM 45817 / CECT 9037 / DDB 130130 / EuI1c) TaxID=298654 RepID=E3J8T0_PSEI1|nr:recombinase family protein [Pseudofrankia inefficax]ADP79663.1 Resolvase domain protein [Pseudofrankia inefficax]
MSEIDTDRWGGTVGELGAALVRVSTGSQDETSQVKILTDEASQRGVTIVKWFRLHGYSASHGAQEPALREAIADIERGDYSVLMVTESSRLDRREDLDAQADILLGIRSAGGDIISIAEPQFGKTDFAGRIVTLVAQYGNAEKSKTVRQTTYRGMSMIIANGGHHGQLPAFWETRGERYARQAFCANPDAVRDVYERLAAGESLQSVGRVYDLYPASVKNLARFRANHTGVVECRYTYEGRTEVWAHRVTPVVESSLWWRVNNLLDANLTSGRGNKGGRPVAQAATWLSGVLGCPSCGASMYVNGGRTPAGNARTPKLRCGGTAKQRLTCGVFKGCEAQPIIDMIDSMMGHDATPILAFQRVVGNAHELDSMRADLARIQGRLSVTEDDGELDRLVADRKTLKADIDGFVVVPDVYDYAETGQTVGDMWAAGDIEAKRGMIRAIREAWGLALAEENGQWGIVMPGFAGQSGANAIVDLGNGLCFRRAPAPATR